MPFDLGGDQAAGEQRILAERLEVAPGLRHADDVDHRREDDVLVARAGVAADDLAVLLRQIAARRSTPSRPAPEAPWRAAPCGCRPGRRTASAAGCRAAARRGCSPPGRTTSGSVIPYSIETFSSSVIAATSESIFACPAPCCGAAAGFGAWAPTGPSHTNASTTTASVLAMIGLVMRFSLSRSTRRGAAVLAFGPAAPVWNSCGANSRGSCAS